jgi:hypothetical protein
MIAYAPAMSLMKIFRRLSGGSKPADEGAADLKAMEPLSGGAAMPGIASPEAVETAEAELSQYEAPSE